MFEDSFELHKSTFISFWHNSWPETQYAERFIQQFISFSHCTFFVYINEQSMFFVLNYIKVYFVMNVYKLNCKQHFWAVKLKWISNQWKTRYRVLLMWYLHLWIKLETEKCTHSGYRNSGYCSPNYNFEIECHTVGDVSVKCPWISPTIFSCYFNIWLGKWFNWKHFKHWPINTVEQKMFLCNSQLKYLAVCPFKIHQLSEKTMLILIWAILINHWLQKFVAVKTKQCMGQT